jgi:hypothetical protein
VIYDALAGRSIQCCGHRWRLGVGVLMIGVDAGSFWSQMQGGVDWMRDVGNGVIKSVVFGITVSFVALLQGFEAQPRLKVFRARPPARWWSLPVCSGSGLSPDRDDVQYLEYWGLTICNAQKTMCGWVCSSRLALAVAVSGAAIGESAKPEL